MECNRCPVQPVLFAFTQANLENSLGRMKTKQIIAAVNNLKANFHEICNACHNLPSQTNDLVADLKEVWNSRYETLFKSIQKDSKDLLPAVEKLALAFRAVCLTCSRASNDDNPSNHGQTFVSLDSGNCQADSGRAKSTATDDNIVQSRADWIGLHKSPDVEDSSYGGDPALAVMHSEEPELVERKLNKTITNLPPECEDRLRSEFSKFVELDIIDKMLISCILSGMNVAEFAKMLWLPFSLVDPKTKQIRAVTKQAMHARWKNICRRFPVFFAIALKSAKDEELMQKKLTEFIEDPNGNEADDRFVNGKMKISYLKAAAREKARQQKLDEKARIEKEKVLARKIKQRRKAQADNKKRMMVWFPQTESECLPGLFG